MVPDRADTWTRWVYSGPNKPVTPIDDPYQMFARLYGDTQDRGDVASVLDELQADLDQLRNSLSSEDRRLLDEQTTLVRELEQELRASVDVGHAVPPLEPGVREEEANMPQLARLQTELLVQSFLKDFTRVATFQFTSSVADTVMSWLGIEGRHHDMSHKPDDDVAVQEQLTKINHWYCEQFAYMAKRLAETPEPGGDGSLLDNTLLVWTNELGKGNTHTLENVPFVLVGGGAGVPDGTIAHLWRAAQSVPDGTGARLRA
ncbi:MAG: DUF1552 domain-containing protein [Planctomycetaceae bacterium]